METRIDPSLLSEDTAEVMERVRREISGLQDLWLFDFVSGIGGVILGLGGFGLPYIWMKGDESILLLPLVAAAIGVGIGVALAELLYCWKARPRSIRKLEQLAAVPHVQSTIKEVARLREAIERLQHLNNICLMLERPAPAVARSVRRIFRRPA